MKTVEFDSCLVVVNYEQGWTLTVYEDGETLRSQSFSDETAAEFGYKQPDGKRLSCDHDLLHHWLGKRLGGGSVNHWILAHEGDADTSRSMREREERLVTGVMMLMRADRVPEGNSWTDNPNEASYYMDFAREILGPQWGKVADEAREFLNGLYG